MRHVQEILIMYKKSYVKWDSKKLWEDEKESYSIMGTKVESLWKELKEGKTYKAQLAKDADTLELLLFLKEQQDIGNVRAQEWFKNGKKI